MKAKKIKKEKVPTAFAGMALAAGLSAVPSAIAAFQGYKGQKEAAAAASDLKAMMPSLSSQEDYYNFYQKQAQATNEAKMQNQLNESIAAGSKTMSGAGSRGVLGGIQGAVGKAAMAGFQMDQQREDKMLNAYEKLIQAKDSDRQRLMNEQLRAEQQQNAGLQTMLTGLQGVTDVASSAILAGLSSKGNVDPTDPASPTGLNNPSFKAMTPIEQANYLAKYGTTAEKGASIEKTPGEFSHDKNPIDIVREGAKIGEMTGGEYIFNPDQMKSIKSMVAKGSNKELHGYMKGLIKEFEKRALK